MNENIIEKLEHEEIKANFNFKTKLVKLNSGGKRFSSSATQDEITNWVNELNY